MKNPQRGDILLVNLEPVVGSEQGKIRPVVVIQNNFFNKTSPVIIVAAITGSLSKTYFTDVRIPKNSVKGLSKESLILGNQIRSIDRSRVIKQIGKLPNDLLSQLNRALMISLQLIDF